MTDKSRPVLVTTAHRGVFFGYASPDYTDGDTIALTDARLAVYWTVEMEGFMGLASKGPGAGCRIGPRSNITLRDVTSVAEVTAEAAKRWEAAKWS